MAECLPFPDTEGSAKPARLSAEAEGKRLAQEALDAAHLALEGITLADIAALRQAEVQDDKETSSGGHMPAPDADQPLVATLAEQETKKAKTELNFIALELPIPELPTALLRGTWRRAEQTGDWTSVEIAIDWWNKQHPDQQLSRDEVQSKIKARRAITQLYKLEDDLTGVTTASTDDKGDIIIPDGLPDDEESELLGTPPDEEHRENDRRREWYRAAS